jgi:hypothetical protein
MKATQWLGLALSAGLLGSSLGCANTVPAASTPAPAVIPQAQSVPGGDAAPDTLFTGERQIMVDGKAMTFDEIRKQLPSRISEADAAKLLVQINPNEVMDDGKEADLQQWRRRAFFGRRFSPFFRTRFRSFSYFPYSNFYFPYYYNAGFYYPYTYPYYSYYYSPFFYRHSYRYWPYSYWW